MNRKADDPLCIVVGAGISGLLAAHRLRNGGVSVVVLEAAPVVGGRMASHQVSAGENGIATFDHGAQYFTVRSPEFRQWLEHWQDAGVVRQWSDRFATPRSVAGAGHPRYRGVPQMRAVAEHLAADIDVRLNTSVKVIRHQERWYIETDKGSSFSSEALLLTPPVPQSLAILDAGGVSLPGDVRVALEHIDYDPCWAVMAILDGPSRIPKPGGLWPGGETIAWMADNQQKGISALPCVTIHGSPAFSKQHFDDDEQTVVQRLLQEAEPWLGARVIGYEARRWRYSVPVQLHEEPSVYCSKPGPLAFAGDAFAGPRVEGAALSGLAAANALRATR